ncbi:MAG: alkaline phosphatase D family protein [Bdellovibrionaceae bacterium]|nr:alkaline phosphatase D family protein [Pseudobdellovibrionaceae bacterium]
MGFRRRDFIKWGLLQTAVLTLAGRAKAEAEKITKIVFKTGPSILQGATDETRTQFSILQDVKTNYEIFVTDTKGRIYPPDEVRPVIFSTHPKKISKVYFSGLFPNEVFQLKLRDVKTQQIADTREFQTLDLTKTTLKFALCSCLKESYHEAEIWKNMVLQKPDVIFFVGDTVYADKGAPKDGADPTHLWKRFCEARTVLEIYYSKKLIPILATWDDHDFGLNDSNRFTYPYIQESQWNFQQFFAQEESHCRFIKRGPGISTAFQYNEQLFLLLDNRTFRDRNGSRDRYAHWGQEQESWMLELMRKNSGPTWLMTGSQVFPSAPFKPSLSRDHVGQFAGFMKELKTTPSKVVFVSGDVHFSEISLIDTPEVGYRTYELTSSAVHSNGIPGAPGVIPNKRRLMGASIGDRNYIMVDSTAKGLGSTFSATCYSVSGKIYFKRNLEV